MKTIQTLLYSVMVLTTVPAIAQKVDEERMQRDIAVAENVLGTLIKQQFEKQKMFFPLEIKSNYQPGYGITFYIPADYTTPIVFTLPNEENFVFDRARGPRVYINNGDGENSDDDMEPRAPEKAGTLSLQDKKREQAKLDMDSVQDSHNLKVLNAAKNFLLDYGDMITQLTATERIIVSNQGERRKWVNQYFNAPNRTHLSVEVLKGDLTQYKQNKITREQALSKMKVINTESVDEVEPDLELLSSIFSRLYRPDLSKTFFVQDNVYFERLKDYGVVYYMQALSSQELGYTRRYVMPTVGLEDIDQATRDKKIKELYPKFEQDLKDNILEYGRTLKSLKDDEVLVFQVKLTRCAGCEIPSTLEYTVKSSVLKDFNANKINKNAALGKFEIKKGEKQ
ncbi:MAG TPA: hypothetical protein VE467_20510 [Chryseolinea sp.]|jgi:hypothetical protein|nr:hypothetical protein [Chryseolinea sp.]